MPQNSKVSLVLLQVRGMETDPRAVVSDLGVVSRGVELEMGAMRVGGRGDVRVDILAFLVALPGLVYVQC